MDMFAFDAGRKVSSSYTAHMSMDANMYRSLDPSVSHQRRCCVRRKTAHQEDYRYSSVHVAEGGQV